MTRRFPESDPALTRLWELHAVKEPECTSRVPVVGPLIVAVRRLWNRVFTYWYVRPILEQQVHFNAQLVRSLSTIYESQPPLHSEADNPEAGGAQHAEHGFGFIGNPQERSGEPDDEALDRWETADLPLLDRHSASDETEASERQSEEETLNFPLSWRSWWESWRYLFDIALAGEALTCRPGDLVLEYAAGPCWVAELLNRLGIRTVSLDLSIQMVVRGRRRFALDQRLNQVAEARFATGDALRLPFADETFDGVIGMNALHHLPSYRTALAEVWRVLKDGGRAAFSEPGAAHALSPVSQTRMKEEGVLEKNVPLPLIRHLAMRAGFSRMRIVPLLQPSTYAMEYSASPADYAPLHAMWEKTLRFSPRERACFVLEKGAPQAIDSRMPPHALLTHRLRAHVTLLETSNRVRSGEDFVDRVEVVNTGDIVWLAEEHPLGGEVTVGVKLCSHDGRMIRDDLGRTPLVKDVKPGERICIDLHIPAAFDPGSYLLKYDLVIEKVAWFEQYGSTPAQRQLEVVD